MIPNLYSYIIVYYFIMSRINVPLGAIARAFQPYLPSLLGRIVGGTEYVCSFVYSPLEGYIIYPYDPLGSVYSSELDVLCSYPSNQIFLGMLKSSFPVFNIQYIVIIFLAKII